MKYLFYISKIYSIPIIKPLVDYLKQHNGNYRFYVSEKVWNTRPPEWQEHLFIKSLKEARKYKPDFVLCPGNFVDFRIPGLKVQLFHGIGVEKEAHYKIRHFFDIYLTSGPFVTERYNRLQKKYPYFIVRETGWPKLDYIVTYDADDIRQKLNIPAGKKIVLYAPTFSTQHESASILARSIPKQIKSDEFWLFKFHELMDSAIIRLFEDIPPQQGRLLKNVEITPYLHAADIMISDTSSVVYEFMALDKPVITFRTQSRVDKGIDIRKSDELRDAIDSCFTHPEQNREMRQKHMQEVNPYLKGETSELVFKTLQDVYEKGEFPRKGKPLNLFRKGQLIYHSMFKKGYMR